MRYALIDEVFQGGCQGETQTYLYPSTATITNAQEAITEQPKKTLNLPAPVSNCIGILTHIEKCSKCRNSLCGNNLLLKFIIFVLLVILFFRN
jgi:hypothetical protein